MRKSKRGSCAARSTCRHSRCCDLPPPGQGDRRPSNKPPDWGGSCSCTYNTPSHICFASSQCMAAYVHTDGEESATVRQPAPSASNLAPSIETTQYPIQQKRMANRARFYNTESMATAPARSAETTSRGDQRRHIDTAVHLPAVHA